MIEVTKIEPPTGASKSDRLHFGIIRIVHEGFYGLFVNPYERLTKAGLKRAQQVLEVGCGPGFFTIPAARIVGGEGHVFALDINPVAVEHVRKKIDRNGLTNVNVRLADASETGLPERSIDVAFLFAVFHAFKNVNQVIEEMHRVLRTNGILSIQTGLSEEKLRGIVTAKGLFNFSGVENRIFVFEKLEAGST